MMFLTLPRQGTTPQILKADISCARASYSVHNHCAATTALEESKPAGTNQTCPQKAVHFISIHTMEKGQKVYMISMLSNT